MMPGDIPPRSPLRAHRGNVYYVDFGRREEDPVDKKRLATILGRSVRWVELQLADGMPSTKGRRGKRMFLVSECRAWLQQNTEGDACA